MLRELMAQLRSSGKTLVPSHLAYLSNLTRGELGEFAAVWSDLPAERRRQVAQWLAELSEDNIEYNFDDVFRYCLGDADAEVRITAIDGLWECSDSSVTDEFIKLMRQDPDERVRATAASALGRFSLLAELGELRASRAEQVDAALESTFRNSGEAMDVRRRALEAASPRNLGWVKQAIRDTYAATDVTLRRSAIYAMGQNCDADWLPLLLSELANPDSSLRYEAAVACGQIEDEAALPHLTPLVHDPDPDVQEAAILSIGQVGGPKARFILQGCLEDRSERVREAAQEALGNIDFGDDPLSYVVH